MFWAIVNGDKVEATPKNIGVCPLCEGKVISKCGEINEWHWAHASAENCNMWYEPETLWHKNWKMTFGKEHAEIVINKNGKRHIADILTKQEVVIELQNSPIQRKVIRQREEFYGERMLWVINGISFKDNFEIYDEIPSWNWHHDPEWWMKEDFPRRTLSDGHKWYKWKYNRKSWEDVQRDVFVDFGQDDLFWVKEGIGTMSGVGKYVTKKKFIYKYGGNYKYYYNKYFNE